MIWTAHLRPGADPARAAIIADRWRWGAFLAPLIWSLWTRRWWLAALVLLTGVALGELAAAGQGGAAFALGLGLNLLFGFEAGALSRLDLRVRGWEERGAVSALSLDEAEARFFARGLG